MDDKAKYLEDARCNAQTIRSSVHDLSSIEESSSTFSQFRDKSQKILELFKTLKPLLKEDREELWNKFQKISKEYYRKHEERKKVRLHASSRKKEYVICTIQDAKNYASADINELRKADELLKQASEMMKPGWTSGFSTLEQFAHISDGKMTKEDSEQCWRLWKEVKEKIHLRRKEVYDNNYLNVKHDLIWISELATTGDPYEALKQIKITQGKVFSHPMARENKDSILNSLSEYRKSAIERIQEKKKEKERKQKEWEEKKTLREKKQKEWEERQKEKERKKREWEERQRERERKKREWEQRQIEKERRQREYEERQRERERKKREYEERKLEQARERERKRQEYEERQRERERRRNKRGSGGGRRKSSGGCYITTATCMTLGKPDNCFELMTIRQFRDNWLSKQKCGKQIIDDYYYYAPLIVDSIDGYSNKTILYQKIWDNYLRTFFEFILLGRNKIALAIYLDMVNKLKKEYLDKKQ